MIGPNLDKLEFTLIRLFQSLLFSLSVTVLLYYEPGHQVISFWYLLFIVFGLLLFIQIGSRGSFINNINLDFEKQIVSIDYLNLYGIDYTKNIKFKDIRYKKKTYYAAAMQAFKDTEIIEIFNGAALVGTITPTESLFGWDHLDAKRLIEKINEIRNQTTSVKTIWCL